MPNTDAWSVQFQDESRDIASEYRDGFNRYAPYNMNPTSIATGREMTTSPLVDNRHAMDQQLDDSQDVSITAVYNRGQDRIIPKLEPSPHMTNDSLAMDSPSPLSRRSSNASFFPGRPASNRPIFDDELPISEQLMAFKAYRRDDSSSAASVDPPGTNAALSAGYESGEAASPYGPLTPPPVQKPMTERREYLRSSEEIYYMKIFVEDVGVWMDAFDKERHFSNFVPYRALKAPMLLNALLACGVKQSALKSHDKNDQALCYYDTATSQLLRTLENPDRNMSECATTAVILNVYEVMSEKPAQRMSHIAGARALVRECGWNAKSTGIGSACFWLNIGMEVLSCLATNWKTTWDPEEWGLDIDFPDHGQDDSAIGQEELWVHRMFYIVAKVANFRAVAKHDQEACLQDQIRLGERQSQWRELKELCDRWNNCCPRSMHPFGYKAPSPTQARSTFPEVWLIKRASIIGRLFYHTAQCILAQTNPMEPVKVSDEMRTLQLHHAHQVCGIVAHAKDRGIASVAIRAIATTSAVLIERREQEEVLHILARINRHSGWRLGRVEVELKKTWGWERPVLPAPLSQGSDTPDRRQQIHLTGIPMLPPLTIATSSATYMPLRTLSMPTTRVAASPQIKTPVNPLNFADFNLPNHPYQNWYEPPNRTDTFNHSFM